MSTNKDNSKNVPIIKGNPKAPVNPVIYTKQKRPKSFDKKYQGIITTLTTRG